MSREKSSLLSFIPLIFIFAGLAGAPLMFYFKLCGYQADF